MTANREANLEAIARLLKDQSTLVLSTSDADRHPHAAALFYLAGPQLELYWFSSASSLHSRHLKQDPRASLAVYSPTEQWNEIRGVQMDGTVAEIVDRAQRREIAKAYRERFHLGNLFRVAMARSSLYVFRPSWARYIDNAEHFGFKFEITFPVAGR